MSVKGWRARLNESRHARRGRRDRCSVSSDCFVEPTIFDNVPPDATEPALTLVDQCTRESAE